MPRLMALGMAFTTALIAGPDSSTAFAFERTETRQACADHDPLRQPFFGDLHVHTTLSFDAWTQGTRNGPRDAYRFARGEAVGIQPYGPGGEPLRKVKLRAPLDFAMVSDHAEMLGQTDLCRTPGSPSYHSFTCILLRRWPALGYMIVNSQWSTAHRPSRDLCGDDGAICRKATAGPWKQTLDAAEEFYDRTPSCNFTTFVGYEWSGSRIEMIHRNVVFRNAEVPDLPVNAIDQKSDERLLWKALVEDCIETDGTCDALAIPHNSNVSAGSMFWTETIEGDPMDLDLATRRRDLEPLVEITQHKGDSECRASEKDPLCEFETLKFAAVAGHASSLYRDPIPPNVYVREGLLLGLAEKLRLGVNPLKLGIIGSTDTHLGTPGLVDEDSFVGHAAGLVTARLEIPALPDHPLFNPGGLAVLWAEENSRDSLFEAMRRREAYGTSGPRIVVRFFGGWDYEDSMCGSSDFVERGYRLGVPMGGDLPVPPTAGSGDDIAPDGADGSTGQASGTHRGPRFAVHARRAADYPDLPGTPLDRIQMIKGWIGADGQAHQKVFDVAGSIDARAGVDTTTCEIHGPGANQLCAVWTDPDFDVTLPAFYYARVLENPTCRWTTHACNAAGIDCAAPLGPSGPYAACCDEETPKTIQERAWTSPIWFSPAPPLQAMEN